MTYALLSVGAKYDAPRRTARSRASARIQTARGPGFERVNWRLIVALVLNFLLWGGVVAGALWAIGRHAH